MPIWLGQTRSQSQHQYYYYLNIELETANAAFAALSTALIHVCNVLSVDWVGCDSEFKLTPKPESNQLVVRWFPFVRTARSRVTEYDCDKFYTTWKAPL